MDDVILPLLAAFAWVTIACVAIAVALEMGRDRLVPRRESRRQST